ncbi:MAG TPA: urate oxidase [Gemmatimonadaceae bacterium]|nr:urate oxidase [Gemmatimonadaceae bacterium]
MSALIARSNYGKSRVRLVKVTRRADRHDVIDLTVGVQLEGDYQAAHVDGDNSAVLPTDTMKNTVYAFAARHEPHRLEEFGIALARHFLAGAGRPTGASVQIEAHDWSRLAAGGRPHPHAFVRGSAERRIAAVVARPEGVRVEAGLDDLLVLKTAHSAFAGYPRDRYTTLAETTDRLLATTISARWRYDGAALDYDRCWMAARQAMLDRFAEHDSKSVQHTLYAMAEAALGACPGITEISLSLPNKHHLLVDLAPFGLTNENAIFVPTDEPHGLIEAVVTRSRA